MRYFLIYYLVLVMIAGIRTHVIAAPLTDTTPTPQWIFFYSRNLQLDGSTVRSGVVVRAYVSRTGQECGSQRVAPSGALPLLTCYMVDPSSNVDGVIGGDVIYFTIDGIRVAETFKLPDTIFNGQRFELHNLSTEIVAITRSCIDGYEDDDTITKANSITGPEAHTFFSPKHRWDRDWGHFTAKAKYVYQIRARSNQPLSLVQPVLKIYDSNGTLLAENGLDKWGRGAEIWWWNSENSDQTIYVAVEEKYGRFGCLHYTLSVTPY